ncbi:MAG: DUF4388 domain-containing protein [Polyangiales bacterium]
MQLPGRLVRTTVGDLLGRLYRASSSGLLELACAGRRHRVHFQRGFVTSVDLDVDSPPGRLGEILVDEGFAPVTAVAAALSRQHVLGVDALPQGEMLVRAGVLSAEVRDAALRRQTRMRLDALFTLLAQRDAEVRFHVGVSAPRARARGAGPLMPREFLHGRPRARDGATPPAPPAANDRGASAPRPSAPASKRSAPLERLRALRLLGLPLGADEATIRRAFRTAAARVHPDRHQALPAHERARLGTALAELSAAYHLLCA